MLAEAIVSGFFIAVMAWWEAIGMPKYHKCGGGHS